MPEILPLFPLHSILFPDGVMELKIFETRYLDMVREVIRDQRPFGVCLIKNGSEVGETPEIYQVGTSAYVKYWYLRDDGLLGISLQGERRFRVINSTIKPNRIMVAEVEYLDSPNAVTVPQSHQALVGLLQQIIDGLGHPYIKMEKRYDDAVWVLGRLAELLPIPLVDKQSLLESMNPIENLKQVADLISQK